MRQVLGKEHQNIVRIMSKFGMVLHKQGKWQEAEEMQRQALGAMCSMLGPTHVDTLSTRYKLACVLEDRGQLEEAEEILRKTLDARCTVGRIHEDTDSMTRLGKWHEAEKLHRKTLERTRRQLGQDDARTLASMNGLAGVLHAQGKWQEAENLHAQTLVTMNNLGMVLSSQGRLQEAEEMYRKASRGMGQVLGKEHQNTLSSMNNLGCVLGHQHRWHEAEEVHRQVLEVRRRVLGPKHHDTLRGMLNLAAARLHDRQQDQEALEMLQEVSDVFCRELGKEHWHTLTVRQGVACILESQGQWQEAENLHTEVLNARSSVVGVDHPDTIHSMKVRAEFLARRDRDDWKHRFSLDEATHQERFFVAVTSLRCAIESLQKVNLGEDHPELLSCREHLAELLVQANNEALLHEAEDLLQLVITTLHHRFGLEHPRTQRAMAKLVFLFEEQGKDCELWKQHLLRDDGAEVPTDLGLNLPEEHCEVSDDVALLLRKLLGLGTHRFEQVAASDETTSSEPVSKVLAESVLSAGFAASSVVDFTCQSCKSSSDSNSESEAWLEAVHREICQRRKGQEEAGTISGSTYSQEWISRDSRALGSNHFVKLWLRCPSTSSA